MTDKHNICIGTVIGPHGVHGAVRVRVHSEDAGALKKYKALNDLDGNKYLIKKLRIVKGQSAVVKFDGLANRSQAEEIAGLELYIQHEQLPDLREDEFYVTDLVGLKVKTRSGQVIDEILTVENHGAGDFITLVSDTKNCIPFTNEAIPEVHLRDGYVVVEDGFVEDCLPGN